MKRAPSTSRRDFLQLTALSVGAMGLDRSAKALAPHGGTVSLIIDPSDPIATSPCVSWALQQLTHSLESRGTTVHRLTSFKKLPSSDFILLAGGCDQSFLAARLNEKKLTVSQKPESLALASTLYKSRPTLIAAGRDARGLMYGLLEIADRVEHSSDLLHTLRQLRDLSEEPCNAIRSVSRPFVSDVEDLPWFHDREMWPAYFSMLATQRINRFALHFGLGYDRLTDVVEAYGLFLYPFLVKLPQYDVRVAGLPDAERDHNLESLRFISDQAAAHGIDFQLGIWGHGYKWINSPHPNYTISGVTPENHAVYCRDALAFILQTCTGIGYVTLRTHAESGVQEKSYSFWETLLSGIKQLDRKVEIDMHTKGLDEELLDATIKTGLRLTLSIKYCAEHLAMPYQPASIREQEMPENAKPTQFASLSNGSRSFTRYGYADFMREDRMYKILYRIFPGSHRFLLWGDPVTASAFAQAFRFCDSDGAELFEPLSFKGRNGSGIAGSRCAYADPSLNPRWDWEKYLYTYRVWGRLLYSPDSEPDVWRRYLQKEFGPAGVPLEEAIAKATRIMPIIVTAHLPSAANVLYNVDFYFNQPIVNANRSHPYVDTPSPKTAIHVSPADPQLFSRMSDYADQLLKNQRTGQYSPIEVAAWLDELAADASQQLAFAERQTLRRSPAYRRAVADIKIQIGIGRFFAAKFRSGTLYSIYLTTGDQDALQEALKQYRDAREIWAQMADGARGIYSSDITYGMEPFMRGHWLDRLPAIDGDLADMEQLLQKSPVSKPRQAAVEEVLQSTPRITSSCTHIPPATFVEGQSLTIELAVPSPASPRIVRVHYRPVDQAERYKNAEMSSVGGQYRFQIPAEATKTPFALQYYFEIEDEKGHATLYPGFTPQLTNQPYFVTRNSIRNASAIRNRSPV